MRGKESEIASCNLHRRVRERTWERDRHLEYSIHGKVLDLVTSLDKKYPDLASVRFQIHSLFKTFHSGEYILKSFEFLCRTHRIRVDGRPIRKEKVLD